MKWGVFSFAFPVSGAVHGSGDICTYLELSNNATAACHDYLANDQCAIHPPEEHCQETRRKLKKLTGLTPHIFQATTATHETIKPRGGGIALGDFF